MIREDVDYLLKDRGIVKGALVKNRGGFREETEYYDIGVVDSIKTYERVGDRIECIIYVRAFDQFGNINSYTTDFNLRNIKGISKEEVKEILLSNFEKTIDESLNELEDEDI